MASSVIISVYDHLNLQTSFHTKPGLNKEETRSGDLNRRSFQNKAFNSTHSKELIIFFRWFLAFNLRDNAFQ